MFAHPRWEDFEYEYVNDNPNAWIGDGWTEKEKNGIIDVDYLDDDQIDFPLSVAGRGKLPNGNVLANGGIGI